MDLVNVIYNIAVGDYVSLTADVAAIFIPYVPAGSTKLVKVAKVAKVADVISIDAKAIKALKVEFQYIGNADGFVKHTLGHFHKPPFLRLEGLCSLRLLDRGRRIAGF